MLEAETAPDANEGEPPETTDEETGEDQDEPRDPEDEVRDAKLKAVHKEASKWRHKFREAEARIKALEEDDSLRAARIELAFFKEAVSRDEPIVDLETAWDLATARGFFDAVEDDGEGMAEALDRLLARYPYLLDGEAAIDREPDQPLQPGGRKVNARPISGQPSRADMVQRFPALRRGRGG